MIRIAALLTLAIVTAACNATADDLTTNQWAGDEAPPAFDWQTSAVVPASDAPFALDLPTFADFTDDSQPLPAIEGADFTMTNEDPFQ